MNRSRRTVFRSTWPANRLWVWVSPSALGLLVLTVGCGPKGTAPHASDLETVGAPSASGSPDANGDDSGTIGKRSHIAPPMLTDLDSQVSGTAANQTAKARLRWQPDSTESSQSPE